MTPDQVRMECLRIANGIMGSSALDDGGNAVVMLAERFASFVLHGVQPAEPPADDMVTLPPRGFTN